MDQLPFDLEPFTKRNTPVDSKINTEFTEVCRNRLYTFFSQVAYENEIMGAHAEIDQEYAREFEGFSNSTSNPDQHLIEFLYNEEHEFVLEYIEYLYNLMWTSDRDHDILLKYDSRLRRIFRDTRILVRLTPDHEELAKTYSTRVGKGRSASKRYNPQRNGPITFEIVGSEALLNADAEIQQITKRSAWQHAVEPYNEAWERYQEGLIDIALFQKLNRALENVIYKICKQDNNWVGDGAGLGACLNELQDRGFFEPNNEIYGEWSQIAKGLQIGLRKPSKDKHRHEEIEEDYAIMVLHQTAAFLTFIIRRYETENR